MTIRSSLIVFAFLTMSACTFDVPLVAEAALPIDPALLGTWEEVPEDATADTSLERLQVREAGPNHYAVEYTDEGSTIHFTAWLAELDGIRFVQLEVTGDDDGPVGANDPDLYSVISYQLEGSELIVRALNTERVDQDISDTAALQAAFRAARDDPRLFTEPGRYRRL